MQACASGSYEGLHVMLYNSVLFVCFAYVCNVMSGLVSVRLVCLRDQIRWISRSLTQMLISVSGVSYVSWCRIKLAVLSDSLPWFKCCREKVCMCELQDIECD